jgi:general secretion pathway protein G
MTDRIKRMKVGKRDAGFTLIELLVVITILGILAAIVVFSVGGIGDKGQKAACQTDTTTIQTAEEAYYAKNTAYISGTAALQSAGFLSTPSTLHDVATEGNGYMITEAAGGVTAKCRTDGTAPTLGAVVLNTNSATGFTPAVAGDL